MGGFKRDFGAERRLGKPLYLVIVVPEKLRLVQAIINYLTVFYEFWSNVADGVEASVDPATVKMVEGRAPKFSETDKKWLLSQMKSHKLFPTVTDAGIRDRIYTKMINWNLLIPSFFNFFEDEKLFRLNMKVLSRLLPQPLKTYKCLREGFKEIYTFSASQIRCLSETGEGTWRHLVGPTAGFELSFWAVFVTAMRLFPDLHQRKPKKAERKIHNDIAADDNHLYLWPLFAQDVLKLGFDSPPIRDLASRAGGQIPAGGSPLRLMVGDGDVTAALKKRCGIPFDDATLIDRSSLYLDNLLQPVSEPGKDITLLFVRRSFLLFWTRESIVLPETVEHDNGTLPTEEPEIQDLTSARTTGLRPDTAPSPPGMHIDETAYSQVQASGTDTNTGQLRVRDPASPSSVYSVVETQAFSSLQNDSQKLEDNMITFICLRGDDSFKERVPETAVKEYAQHCEQQGLNCMVEGRIVGPQECVSALRNSASRTVMAYTADRVNSAQEVTGYTPAQAVERDETSRKRKFSDFREDVERDETSREREFSVSRTRGSSQCGTIDEEL